MAGSTETTLNKHIRVLPEQWKRIERAAPGNTLAPNQLVVQLAIEALDRRDWPRSETEIRVTRASLFVAQVLARDLIVAGRDKEVEEVGDSMSTIAPDPDAETQNTTQPPTTPGLPKSMSTRPEPPIEFTSDRDDATPLSTRHSSSTLALPNPRATTSQ